MGILRGNRHTGRGAICLDRLGAQSIGLGARGEADDGTFGRCEAQAIVSRTVAADPYAAWLERREAEERLQEQPEIRWVYRHSRSAGGAGGAAGGDTRETPAARGSGSPRDGLVVAA